MSMAMRSGGPAASGFGFGWAEFLRTGSAKPFNKLKGSYFLQPRVLSKSNAMDLEASTQQLTLKISPHTEFEGALLPIVGVYRTSMRGTKAQKLKHGDYVPNS